MHDLDVENLRNACADVFIARAAEATLLRREPRDWPPTIVGHPGWDTAYTNAASEGGVELSLQQGIEELNAWIREIDTISR